VWPVGSRSRGNAPVAEVGPLPGTVGMPGAEGAGEVVRGVAAGLGVVGFAGVVAGAVPDGPGAAGKAGATEPWPGGDDRWISGLGTSGGAVEGAGCSGRCDEVTSPCAAGGV
jgi:hypothetical protein